MGQETKDTIIYDFVGMIDGQGNFVRIGVSALGFIIEGAKFESGELNAITVGLLNNAANREGAFRFIDTGRYH